MKRSEWRIRRRLIGMTTALTSMLAIGAPRAAFARQLDDGQWGGAVPASGAVPTTTAPGGSDFWSIAAIVGAVIATLAAAVWVARMRGQRRRTAAAAA